MDTMERYKIQGSIEDVIDILDSAPMHRDLIPETMIVQLTNRVPIAHLAIERGLKARIASVGGTTEPIHSLNGGCWIAGRGAWAFVPPQERLQREIHPRFHQVVRGPDEERLLGAADRRIALSFNSLI